VLSLSVLFPVCFFKKNFRKSAGCSKNEGHWRWDGGLAIGERRSLVALKSISEKEKGLSNIQEVTDQIDGSEVRFEVVERDGRCMDKVLVHILSNL